MKYLFIISAIACILLQTFSSSIIYINYQVNKEYISKNLCENRNKPKMHCNGKCHLRKQLAAQQKKENAPLQNLKEKFEIQFCSQITPVTFSEFNEDNTLDFTYSFFIPQASLSSIFHPPQA